MATFIKAGFWEKLCKPCKGYKGWLNLDEFVKEHSAGPSYKIYTALLNQSGTNAPVATILENTLGGTPVWTRSTTGVYGCTLSGAFPANKTFCLVSYGLEEGTNVCPLFGRSNNNQVYLYAKLLSTGSGADFNNSPANDISVEIRVYP